MNRLSTLIASTAIAAVSFSTVAMAAKAPFSNPTDKVSYSIGLDLGKNFYKQKINLNTSKFMEGLNHGLQDKKPLLTDEEIRETMMEFQTNLMQKQKDMYESSAKTNKTEGESFLAKNKNKKGIVTLPSGLQYRVVKKGKGNSPKLDDTVTTHYRGTLIDGTEFDSSYKRGEPVKFPVKGVIPGWTEALQIMKPGDKWELYVPSNLGYGERGAGQIIGPNATLIFEIELISIEQSS